MNPGAKGYMATTKAHKTYTEVKDRPIYIVRETEKDKK